MLTDPKSGDYLSWFYCTRENQRGQIAQLVRRRFCDEPATLWPIRANAQSTATTDPKFDHFAEGDSTTHGVDVADLIKQARLQTDRHPAWMREAGPVERQQSCPDQATFQLQTFIGGLAHHFNNLFMVIQGNLSLMQMAQAGRKQQRQRFKRMEKLIQCESMLTNDLLGPTVDPRYRCNVALQTRILGEIILIAEQIRPTGNNLCVFPVPLDAGFMSVFLPRLAGNVATILDRLIQELYHHCQVIMADLSKQSDKMRRMQTMIAELRRGMLWSAKLGEYAGDSFCNDQTTEKSQLVEIAFDTWTCRDRRIPMNLTCKETLPTIFADPVSLHRIFEELYANAETFCPNDASVSVDIRTESNGVCITIRDTGTGIDENLKDALCLPFFSTRTPLGYCGLGLASVEGILRGLGGTVAVEAQADAGTAVTCWLPSAEALYFDTVV